MKDFVAPPQANLRPPEEVMRLSRMGVMFPTRLSFLRVLTRALADYGTPPERMVWDMDSDGYGRAVYKLDLYGHTYSLVALSQALPDDARSDRVIATAWDAAFVLYDGVPDGDELARIAAAAPLQEAGRFSPRDLVLSRANKSVRLWRHVVERLRVGDQPDAEMVNDIGYLMRTTAVYGNGKFGIADRAQFADRPGMAMSFMAEMLTVWMIRHFTHDLVEHVGGAPLERGIKRHLGIGNATGLGMAPFLVTHPVLLNNWMMVREVALARVRARPPLTEQDRQAYETLASRATVHLTEWRVPDPEAQAQIDALAQDWADLWSDGCAESVEEIWQRGQSGGAAVQELLLALLLEPCGSLVDGLAECLHDPHGSDVSLDGDTDGLRAIIAAQFDWALTPDFTTEPDSAQFWYVSEEKLEPRLGLRFEEPGAELESPLDVARRVQALAQALPEDNEPVRDFLMRNPEHLMAVERVLIAPAHPYGDVQDNLISAECRPIDLLRAKLSQFGATKFDPKSTLWTRVTLAQGAPLADELQDAERQGWWCPTSSA